MRIIILLLSLGLAGCATLDREECQTADWQLIGFNDGVAGRSAERLETHREACADYGISPLMDDYLDGHYRGAERYCTAENGYNRARAGQGYNAVCSGGLSYDFERGFELGQEAYRQLQQQEQVERLLSDQKSSQREDENRIAELEKKLVADKTKPEQRYQLLRDIESLRDQIYSRKPDIQRLKTEVEMERRYSRQLEQDLRQQL